MTRRLIPTLLALALLAMPTAAPVASHSQVCFNQKDGEMRLFNGDNFTDYMFTVCWDEDHIQTYVLTNNPNKVESISVSTYGDAGDGPGFCIQLYDNPNFTGFLDQEWFAVTEHWHWELVSVTDNRLESIVFISQTAQSSC